MSAQELWQWVHLSYGDELGLTSSDDDYVPPAADDEIVTSRLPLFDLASSPESRVDKVSILSIPVCCVLVSLQNVCR